MQDPVERLQSNDDGVDGDPWHDVDVTQVEESVEEKQVDRDVDSGSYDSGVSSMLRD